MITGANRGIGLEFVRQLIQNSGNRIFAATRKPEESKELQALAQANQQSLIVIKMDVQSDAEIAVAAEEVDKVVGAIGIQALFNNAGVYMDSGKKISEMTRDIVNQTLDVNVTSQLMVAKAFRPLLAKGANQSTGFLDGHSIIVNISSEMGSITNASTGSYGYRASKSALNMVARCLAHELVSEGIYSVAMHPGWVQTDMGGEQATVKPEDSVAGMIKVVSKFTEAQNGHFVDFAGNQRAY